MGRECDRRLAETVDDEAMGSEALDSHSLGSRGRGALSGLQYFPSIIVFMPWISEV